MSAESGPPFLASASVATAAGAASVQVIAAPGAGNALRIVWAQIGINRVSAAAIVDANLQDGAAKQYVQAEGLSLAGSPRETTLLPEPGYQLPTNSALTLSTAGTAATGSGVANVAYYIDAVS